MSTVDAGRTKVYRSHPPEDADRCAVAHIERAFVGVQQESPDRRAPGALIKLVPPECGIAMKIPHR